MLSLVSRCSPRFCSSYVPIVCISSLLVSRFSIFHRRSEPISAAPSAIHPAKHDPQRKDRREALKLRYANDPEYREKLKARANARYANDAVYREKRKAQHNMRYANDAEYREKRKAQHNARYANDAEYRESYLARNSAWQKARYASDPEYFANRTAARYRSNAQVREAQKARIATFLAKQSPAERDEMRRQNVLRTLRKYHNDFLSRQRNIFRTWIRRSLHKQELTWRTHEAELNASEVTHTCSGPNCGYERKLKLWMKRKESDPPLYDCFKCFTSEWVPEKVLPIGYEHVVFGSGEKIEPRRV